MKFASQAAFVRLEIKSFRVSRRMNSLEVRRETTPGSELLMGLRVEVAVVKCKFVFLLPADCFSIRFHTGWSGATVNVAGN